MKPSDFYFTYKDSDDFEGITNWVVTPKKLWDASGVISDQSEADMLVQQYGLERLMESIYESECENPSDTRDKLISAGFIYNNKMLAV